jgi:hypothetical protein
MDSKIDTKITLFDAENKRVGETFSRRARQLVKQQRAVWTDESHTAIRFLPDAMETWEMEATGVTASDDLTKDDSAPASREAVDIGLYALAKKRISARRRMFWHTLGLFPGVIIIALFGEELFRYSFIQGFFYGVAFTLWTVAYIYTVRQFIKHNRGFFPFSELENRQARKLAEEVERLKRMGYGG